MQIITMMKTKCKNIIQTAADENNVTISFDVPLLNCSTEVIIAEVSKINDVVKSG